MAKKRKTGNLTPEDHARHAELQKVARERIAERLAIEAEMERAANERKA